MRQARLLIVPLAAASLLSACVVAPYYPRRAVYAEPVPAAGPYYEPQQQVIVDVAPPAPYVEVVPVIPFPGAIWIGGYWGWQGNRHQWAPGRWERPRPGYNWRPHAWVQQGGRWHQQGGVWVR